MQKTRKGIDSSESSDYELSSDTSKPQLYNQNDLDDLIRDLNLPKNSAELLASRLKERGLLLPETKISVYRKRDDHFRKFFTSENQLVYCNDIENLIKLYGIAEDYHADNWRLFIDSSIESLKAVLLHNGNKYTAIPVGHSTILKESYNSFQFLLERIHYENHKWLICGDLKMINIIVGLQSGYTKNPCFLCLWDSRAKAEHWTRKEWPKRNQWIVGANNVVNESLVDRSKVLLPPLHIKLGLMKQFTKALNTEGKCFKYLQSAFPNISDAKLREGSSGGEQRKQRQSSGAVVSEVTTPGPNATIISVQVSPSSEVGSSEEVSDSSENADAIEEEDSGDDEEDGDEDEYEEDVRKNYEESEQDEFEEELRVAAVATTSPQGNSAIDEEVSELLEIKKQKNTTEYKEDMTKDKRVPTVKKELSSQREILTGGNGTQLLFDDLFHDEQLNNIDEQSQGILKNEVSELLEIKKQKNTTEYKEDMTKDKRVPTVKKELSSQREILTGGNGTQLLFDDLFHDEQLNNIDEQSQGILKNELQEAENYETSSRNEQREQQQQEQEQEQKQEQIQEPPVSRSEWILDGPRTVSRAGLPAPKELSKRHQGEFLDSLKAYLLDKYRPEREKLRFQEILLYESLLNLMANLPENTQLVHQLLPNIATDLNYTRRAFIAQKHLGQDSNHLKNEAEMPYLITSVSVETQSPKPTSKTKKKKKKKINHRKLKASMAIPLVAEKLFGQPWGQNELKHEDSTSDKVRSSQPHNIPVTTPNLDLNKKERKNLNALNTERQALMLKAAREYTQPRLVHFGKINTHQQTSSVEDLRDGFSNARPHPREHFGKLVSPSSSRIVPAYIRSRNDEPSYPIQVQQHLQPQQHNPDLDLNLALNQEYLPQRREFTARKFWQADVNPYRYGGPWNNLGEPTVTWNSWTKTFPSSPMSVGMPNSWLPWYTQSDFSTRLAETEEKIPSSWQVQQQQQEENWARQDVRDNLPPWLVDKDVYRSLHTSDTWPKSEYKEFNVHREGSIGSWDDNRNNNSRHEYNSDSKDENESKESPKLTMKTWNSLTSDPATWPFKLPGAKPWPKDENGNTYNPNAELVRKLGLYKNEGVRTNKDVLKDLKQQKLKKNNKQEEIVQKDNIRTISWDNKVESMPSKFNAWPNSVAQQSSWYQQNHWKNENPALSTNSDGVWSREKLPDEWNTAKGEETLSTTWPNKWKHFAYHKVTAEATSKSGISDDKPNNRNTFIAVSALSLPRYGSKWMKNDIEEAGQLDSSTSITNDLNNPANQMRMNIWKKSNGINRTSDADGEQLRIDILENQLENLKANNEPVLLEVNVSIKNSTSHETRNNSLSTSMSHTVTDIVNEKQEEASVISEGNRVRATSFSDHKTNN